MDQTTALVSIIVAAIGAGLLGYFKDGIRALTAGRKAASAEARESLHVVTADQSLLVVVKARDELEADNARIRAEAAEDRRRYSEDRASWDTEKREMRSEIDELEAKLRGLLDEVSALKRRHTAPE